MSTERVADIRAAMTSPAAPTVALHNQAAVAADGSA